MQRRRPRTLLQPRLWPPPWPLHCPRWISCSGLLLLLWLCFLNLWGGLGFGLSDHVLRLAFLGWKYLWKQMGQEEKCHSLHTLTESSLAGRAGSKGVHFRTSRESMSSFNGWATKSHRVSKNSKQLSRPTPQEQFHYSQPSSPMRSRRSGPQGLAT